MYIKKGQLSQQSALVSTCGNGIQLNVIFSVLQVHVNGLVSFGIPLLSPVPSIIPTGTNIQIICPFWADIDLETGPGKVFYHEHVRDTHDSTLNPVTAADKLVFDLATKHIQTIVGDNSFFPTSVIVVTWQAVSPFYSEDNPNEVDWFDCLCHSVRGLLLVHCQHFDIIVVL